MSWVAVPSRGLAFSVSRFGRPCAVSGCVRRAPLSTMNLKREIWKWAPLFMNSSRSPVTVPGDCWITSLNYSPCFRIAHWKPWYRAVLSWLQRCSGGSPSTEVKARWEKWQEADVRNPSSLVCWGADEVSKCDCGRKFSQCPLQYVLDTVYP